MTRLVVHNLMTMSLGVTCEALDRDEAMDENRTDAIWLLVYSFAIFDFTFALGLLLIQITSVLHNPCFSSRNEIT